MMNELLAIQTKEKVMAVGLMSGTSLDGIDAALIEITKDKAEKQEGFTVKLNAFITVKYPKEIREDILKLCAPETSNVRTICSMNVKLGELMARAACQVVEEAKLTMEDIDFVSSHGQTIYHEPEEKATLQIGELAVIAAETGRITVGDFRPSDLAVGGQGAPLVPYTDYLLFKSQEFGRALINIGGISNITIIEAGCRGEQVVAFDMGPGNMLIDALMVIGTEGSLTYDKDGIYASEGTINKQWLQEILENDKFLEKEPPKSTGREAYTMAYAQELYNTGLSKGMQLKDMIATITEYTVLAIVGHFQRFVDVRYHVDEVMLSGGGVFNHTIVKRLKEELKQKVDVIEAWGYSSEAKEAISFALLGYQFLLGHTNNLPSATGAKRSVSMGKLALPY